MVQAPPRATYFKPQGVPLSLLQELVVPVEGLEALRLADVERLDHETAAEFMGVSRPTFSRLLTEARAIVARALVGGLALRIEGGAFVFSPGRGAGRSGFEAFGRGRWGRRGRRRGGRG